MGGWWKDWDERLILDCHKKKKGKSYRTVYGRMDWDRPSPTITTQCLGLGNGQFGHPEQDRAISAREAALLQTFPRAYRFVEPRKAFAMQLVALQIGNAVPVRLARIVARSIRRHLSMCGAA
jgi:DNA (cytosine-5)-methyltransferase 1